MTSSALQVYLCSLGCSGTCSIDQSGLKFRDFLASASQGLELKLCVWLRKKKSRGQASPSWASQKFTKSQI